VIRQYEDKDIDNVLASWRRASELAHPFLTSAFLDQEADNVRNIYLAVAETWVMDIDDAVVGFIALIDNEIGGLFLDPKHHGQGHGRALVDRAVAEKGPLKVEVFRENLIGRRFYDAYGFQEIEEYVHEASGQPTIRMSYSPSP